MPVPKRKTSKMKKRQRAGSKRYDGVQPTTCPTCAAPVLPHRVCAKCGTYKKKQVITVSE